ncbi:MAG: leucyl/phenylalanyl-tRNA--protein transferase [Actinomycetota bacterium]|nr:leucyl/phenylalanyl-tRNA--protein transferase [Actinomycetota bacterium]
MRQSTGELTWWSADPRGILTVDGLRVTKSLRRSQQRFRTTVDERFDEVVEACAHRDADAYHWITDEIRKAYGRLHQLGRAHSVEVWTLDADDEPSALVGGLYGVALGGLFAGESMFHRRPDASKVALVALVDVRRDEHVADRLIDLQWLTPHLASLGATEVARDEYLDRLRRALALPPPAAFAPT